VEETVKNTPEETYEGIPRNKIPWHPKIDYDKCINCGKCIEYCTLGVYELEKKGKKRPVVKNPTFCVVLCTGCEEICPCDAIRFPSKEETEKIIKKLRKRVKKLGQRDSLHSQAALAR
jgi:NAD-dependent dihydropyrimidine dehydrogenase PreA subunit